jgi:cytochrome P450
VQAAARTATEDTSIGVVEISAGSTALVIVAHHCLGASLARLEIAAALPKILARHPALAGAPLWRDPPAFRGTQTMRITLSC